MSNASNAHSSKLLNHVLTSFLSEELSVDRNLPFVLEIIINHQLLAFSPTEDNVEESAVFRKWTVRLNALLNSKNASVRCAAIALIKITCEQSSAMLVANIQTWSMQLLNLVLKPEPEIVHKEAITTLSYIFQYTANKPELQREITSPNMSRFNQALLTLSQNRELLPTTLSALAINAKLFPSASRHVADHCQKLCLTHMDGSNYLDQETTTAIARCMASLYQTGVKVAVVDQWKQTILRLIGSVHVSLDRLFDSVDEEYDVNDALESFPSPPLSIDFREAFPVLARRIHILEECIIEFTSTQTTVAVPMPVSHLLDLVCRIYNVYEGSLMREYKEKAEFDSLMSFLPSLHLGANKLLASILYCSGQEMSRYSKLFSRILLRLLTEHKSKRVLKISVYTLMSLCFQKCGYAFANAVAKPLCPILLEDIKLVEEQKMSVMTPSHGGKKSGKKRRLEVTNSDALATTETISAADTEVQLAALSALESLLTYYGSSMENIMRTSIDSLLLSTILQGTQMTETPRQTFVLAKQKLYQCLLTSVMNPIETQASILPHAMRIFSAGVNDQTQQLRLTCLHGLAVCDLIIHPRLPPIQRAPIESSSVHLPDTEAYNASMASQAPPATRKAEAQDNGSFGSSSITDYSTEHNSKKQKVSISEVSESPESNTTTIAPTFGQPKKASPIQHTQPSTSSLDIQKDETKTFTVTANTTTTILESVSPADNEANITLAKPVESTNVSSVIASISSEHETSDIAKTEPVPHNINYVAEDMDDEDMMEIPEIDLAGPDSDEED
ncbi:rRNA processing/ribosome biogenesis-domain-containing protein [Phycomyces nitens]|nr:rRNA processing/ribosome biogenesis-domain-containing protein [Phycomyces nitens]